MWYKAKHAKTTQMKQKPVILVAALVLLFCCSIGGTLAYLITQTGQVVNTFTPSEVEISVEETLGTKKENVKIANTGDVDAYIRAVVVVTWQDANGNTYATAPVAGTDYTITWNYDDEGNDWFKAADGYYYHATAIAANTGETDILFTACEDKGTAPDGYDLHVEILAQAIQSEPITAVKDAWGVTVADDGTISK